MANDPGKFALIPHVQTRLASDATHRGGDRLELAYDLEIRADNRARSPRVPVSAALRGPGDVIALQPGQISRQEPTRGLRGFEPNYFPFIEFVDADLPWRYSLDSRSGSKKQPWLILLALKPDEFDFLPHSQSPLPCIQVHSADESLPDLSQAWAFAHVQVNVNDDGSETAEQALASNAAAGFARVICPRKLEERQSYYLFLVPSYRAGVQAGAGQAVAGANFDEAAWQSGDSNVVLPFYHESRFSTDSNEDLEELLKRLRANKANAQHEAGAVKQASAAQPGYYLDYQKPGAKFDVQTALVQPGKSPGSAKTDIALARRMAETLNTVIRGDDGDDNNEDPLLAFPAYGFRFQQETKASTSAARSGDWFHRTNLDLPMRQAAATGARVVAENQELFSKICWEQYEDILAVNQRLARLRFAEEMVNNVSRRHFEKLDADTALVLSEPIQSFVTDRTGKQLNNALREKGIPASYASRSLRRTASKRPVRSKPAAGGRTRQRIKHIPSPAIPGDIAKPITANTGQPGKDRRRLKREQSGLLTAKSLGPDTAVQLRQLLGEEAFKTTVRPRTIGLTVQEFAVDELVSQVVNTVKQFPKVKARFVVKGLLEPEKKLIQPVYRSPQVPLPLADYLLPIAGDALLNNSSGLPENTVTVFEENRHFLEAFMVGANHAMNEELRWREFPTDMRGTIFKRFWNRGYPASDERGDDITAIHGWQQLLGNNPSPSDQDRKANLVVMVRGDVVRKLGQPIIVINVANTAEWQKDDDSGNHEPIFFGKIDEGTAFYGFDVSREHLLSPQVVDRAFFVIYEPMGRLRFGLDVGNAAVRLARANPAKRSLNFPLKALNRSYDDLPVLKQAAPAAAPTRPGRWDELSWSHVSQTSSGYVRFDRSMTIQQGQPELWGARRTSASLARSFWQKPIAAVLPLKRVL